MAAVGVGHIFRAGQMDNHRDVASIILANYLHNIITR